MYRLREEREMSTEAFANMVTSMLYEARFGPFFCEPIIAGLGGEVRNIAGSRASVCTGGG